MDADSAMARLKELGLNVYRHVPGAMTDQESMDGMTIARSTKWQGEIETLIDVCFVFPLQGAWVYRNWNGIGGRAPDDVHIEGLNLETAIRHVESFYFGTPVIINGWSFPIHKHPEWDSAQIIASLDTARQISESQWLGLRAARFNEARTLGEDEKFRKQFREIESVRPDRTSRLWTRNDLQEMVLVVK
ncbi:MAG: hypothetical protein J0M26_00840 [Planctomycetes bacterium]|nr:hypothetical protein [Planctomycetota bacterium]